MKNKKKSIISTIIILILFVIVTYTAYAIFNGPQTSDINTINTGQITTSFTEGTTVNLSGSDSMSDDEGKIQTDYFEFALATSVQNQIKIAYYIYAIPDESNTISSEYIKVYLTKVQNTNETGVINPTLFNTLTRFNANSMVTDNTANNYLLYSNIFEFNETGEKSQTFHLRLWLDQTYPGNNPNITNTDNGNDGANHSAQITNNSTFKFKINVYSEQGDIKL